MGTLGTGIDLVYFVQCNRQCPNFFQNSSPFSIVLSTKAKSSLPRLRVSNYRKKYRIAACLNGDNAKKDFDPCLSTSNTEEAKIDIGLPRRSLLVQFTCDACGDRTSRLINRVAYERGTVFLQCKGCQVYHKFVDNLGLVVEYDLREEQSGDMTKDS